MQKATKNGFREIIPNFTGMDGLTDPSKLNEVQLALLENYTLKSYGNIGSLVSRNGFTRYNTNQIASGGTGVGSMYETTLNGTDYLLANIINSSSSALYYRTSPYTASFSTIKTDATLAYKLNYATFKNKVYMANVGGGASPNAVWDGTNYLDMGCIPPNPTGISLTQLAGAGALSAGLYRYLFTFIYDGFQESSAITYYDVSAGVDLAPVATFSTSANDAIQIDSIPTGSARVTARKIYRTKASGTDYYYLTTIQDNTTTTFKDGLADTFLSELVDSTTLCTPNKPKYSKYISLHKERGVLGYLTESLYDAIPTGDITLTEDAGGSLDLLGTYKYRFYKAWRLNASTVLLSKPLDKTITLTGGNQSVLVNYTGSDNWFQTIAFQRTDGGGSEFKWIGGNSLVLGREKGHFPFDDGIADGGVALGQSWHIFADDVQASYPNNIIISDAGKPDLFSNIETAQDGTLIPASNEWNVGEAITGIHSEEDRIVIFGNKNIYELDTTAQSRQFWRLNKIISDIGADDGLQCQVGKGYMFINTGKPEGTNSSVEKIYLWDGRSKPQSIGEKIMSYCLTNAITEYLDLKYDSANENVQIICTNTGGTQTYILQFDLNSGNWEIFTNGTNLNLKCLVYTKNFGLLVGSGDGYVHYQKATQYQDVIAGSNTPFTTKLRTKTWELYDTDLRPRRLRADISTTGAVTPVLKTAVDGTLNSGDNMTALASGFNRPNQTLFTNAQQPSFRQVYFQLEMTANVQQKVHGLMIDFTTDHEDSGGR